MYGLDINFLNDRPEYKKDIPKPASSEPSLEDTRPIIVGAAVAIAINGLVAGGWLYLNDVNNKLQGNLDKLNGELSKLDVKVKDLKAIKEKAEKFLVANFGARKVKEERELSAGKKQPLLLEMIRGNENNDKLCPSNNFYLGVCVPE